KNMRHNPNECANCGADRRPGSTLCKDCIIARGGRHNVHIIEGKYFMEIFYNEKKCAEIDLAGWAPREVARVIDIERLLLGRTIKINRVITNR
ncbi:unnamed protein product, partial [marine sediment metagenome]